MSIQQINLLITIAQFTKMFETEMRSQQVNIYT